MSHNPQFSISRAPLPTRFLSTCRSCSSHIAVGDLRMQIAYPTKLILYKERTGSPSFFVHFNCFLSAPVNYVQEGSETWTKIESACEPYKVDIKTLKGLEKFSKEERNEIEGKFK